MPKGNVKFANPEKVMTEANFRRHGGHCEITTTNGQGFVYVPQRYEYRGHERYRVLPGFYRASTTANTLRSISGASIDKPPSRNPPGNFKLGKKNKHTLGT